MTLTIDRRQFAAALGGAAVWPIAARGQQAAVSSIGFLDSTMPEEEASRVFAFRQGLNDAGFFEGQNLTIEYRWAESRLDRLPALAADLVGRRVTVIVANAGAARAAIAATSQIPIVFVSGGDPVQSGFVTNLNRPNGNVTGVSFYSPPLQPKRLELLSELVPKPAVIGVLVDSNSFSPEKQVLEMYEASARAIGRQILIIRAGNDRDFGPAFETLVRSKAGGLLIGTSAFFTNRRRLLAALATRHAIPTIHTLREFVMAGGLMSYGASRADAYRRAGVYVGRILKGAKPGDLPVELPSKYELVVNFATARAIGLDFPPKLQALADEVID
jgi:putative ABC transport system substrate-binding protein